MRDTLEGWARRGRDRLSRAFLITCLLALVLAAPAAAVWPSIVRAVAGSLSTYTVPPPTNLRCTGTLLSGARIVWDPVEGAAGQSLSYRVTNPAGAVTTSTDTFHELPAVGAGGEYRVQTVIASGWSSSSSRITVTLGLLGAVICTAG